nr:hypothetical protein [Tanacetum cinerariifolium]
MGNESVPNKHLARDIKFWNTPTSKTINSVKQIHAIVDGKAVVISESSVRREGDRVERGITTDASLKAAQASDNILKTHTTTMPNVDIPQGIDTGGSPRHQETILKQKRTRVVIYSSDEEEPSVHIEDSPKQGRMIEELDKDEDVNLVSQQGEVQETAEPSKE